MHLSNGKVSDYKIKACTKNEGDGAGVIKYCWERKSNIYEVEMLCY